jgi:hypothetical protein
MRKRRIVVRKRSRWTAEEWEREWDLGNDETRRCSDAGGRAADFSGLSDRPEWGVRRWESHAI